MTEYQLAPNEMRILRADSAWILRGRTNTNCRLLLTNQNLVITITGFLGGVKEIERIPLDQIKRFNGQPLVRYEKSIGSSPGFSVDSMQGSYNLLFNSRREAKRWVGTITQVLTGGPIDMSQGINSDDDDVMADFREGIDSIKEAFGLAAGGLFGGLKGDGGTNASHAKKSLGSSSGLRTAGRCYYCGAPISGRHGEVVRCEYCDGEQELE